MTVSHRLLIAVATAWTVLVATLAVDVPAVHASTPGALTARHSHGQTFLTWPEAGPGVRYHVYRSSSPITSATLASAVRLTQRWGPLGDATSRHVLAGENAPANFVIADLGAPLTDATGLFVHTVAAGDALTAFYAVTRVTGGVEDRAIVPGSNATTVGLAETVSVTRPILVTSENGGRGRVYTHFMDYARWNPTRQGYAYNYAVGLPRDYDPRVAYPIKLELHAYDGRYRAVPEAEYDWPAIHVLTDDPALGLPDSRNAGHSWWFGFAADHDYRTAATPSSGRVANFTEYRVLKALDEVAALFRTDPRRTHAFGHSMGGSGAFALGLRYGNVFSATYASQPMTDYQHSPLFVEEWTELWGSRAANLPLTLIGPHAEPLARFASNGAAPTGVWDWQNLQAQAGRLAPIGPAFLTVAHGKDDSVIDWPTQGRPLVGALTSAAVPFTALARDDTDHSWMGFEGANHDMVSQGYGDYGDFILDRGPVPAFGRASGSGALDPTDVGTQTYNVDLNWATATNGRGPAPVELPARFEMTLMSGSGAAQTADVTPRRTALDVPAGSVWQWRTVNQATGVQVAAGTVTAASAGTVTVPRVRILAGAGTRLVLTTGGAPEQKTSLAWFPATDDGRVRTYSDQLPMNEMSDEQVMFAARNYVGSQKQTAPEIARLRAVNPDFALLHYRLATASGPLDYIRDGDWGSDWAAVNSHENWFEHNTATGARLYQTQHQWYLHDVTNAAFRDYWISSTIADMRATGAQGTFADSYTAGIGGLLGEPTGDSRFDGTGALTGPWVGGTWLDRLAGLATAVHDGYAATAENFLYLPNLGNLTTSWATLDYSAIDGGMLEDFGQDAPGYWADAAEYAAAMDRALELSAQDKLLILQTEQIDARHRGFLIASYYLLQGERTYLNVVAGDSRGMYWWPEYDLDLGEPLADVGTMAAYDAVDGRVDQVYRRDFSRGTVIVNGADVTRTVTLPEGAWLRVTGVGGGAVNDDDIDSGGGYVGGSLITAPVSGTLRMAPGDAAIVVPTAGDVGAVFVPVDPARTTDTRTVPGVALAAGETRTLSVAADLSGAPAVPPGASAVAYNLTVPSPRVGGHLRVMPADAANTPASAINVRAGETIANASVVPLDGARRIRVLNATGASTHVVVDVVGYYLPVTSAAAAAAVDDGTATRFTATGPARAYDAAVDPAGPLPAGQDRVVRVDRAQVGGAATLPAGATAVAYNVTVAGPDGAGHLRVMPADQASSTTSTINWATAQDRIANASVVGVDDGRIRVLNGSGVEVRFIIDVVGYFAPGEAGALFHPLAPVRVSDSRPAFGGTGALVAAEARVVSVAGPVGSAAMVPAGAVAVAANVTTVATTGAGHLRVYPADRNRPDASLLNWPAAGYTRSNASVLPVSPDRAVRVYNGSGGSSHAIVDVVGYYR